MNETVQDKRRDLELVARRALACPRCNGTGTLSGEPRTDDTEDNCGLCHGSGLYADEVAVNRLVEALAGDAAEKGPLKAADRPA